MNHRMVSFALILGVVIGTSLTAFAQTRSTDRTELYGRWSLRIGAQAINHVGDNVEDATFGPMFRMRVGYDVIPDLTVFVESGYGWVADENNDDLRAVQIPIIGGAVYDLGPQLSSHTVRPYVGAGAGVFLYRTELDGELVTLGNEEQEIASFGLEGILGVSVLFDNLPLAVDIHGTYDHVFSDDDKPGLQSQDWDTIGFGAGVTWYFGR